jgi:hypothetical protein
VQPDLQTVRLSQIDFDEGKMSDANLAVSNSLVDLAARIRIEHEATASALKSSVEHAMAAGELLIEAKSQLKHGQWLPWLAEHCVIPERTAHLYMRLARNRPEIEISATPVADMSIRGAVALLTVPRRGKAEDKFVTNLVDGAADLVIDGFDIASIKTSEAAMAYRAALREEVLVMIERLERHDAGIPDCGRWDAAFNELWHAYRLPGNYLQPCTDRDITEAVEKIAPFDHLPQATAALEKIKDMVVDVLRRVEAAVLVATVE